MKNYTEMTALKLAMILKEKAAMPKEAKIILEILQTEKAMKEMMDLLEKERIKKEEILMKAIEIAEGQPKDILLRKTATETN